MKKSSSRALGLMKVMANHPNNWLYLYELLAELIMYLKNKNVHQFGKKENWPYVFCHETEQNHADFQEYRSIVLSFRHGYCAI
jgi:hypothetical protein